MKNSCIFWCYIGCALLPPRITVSIESQEPTQEDEVFGLRWGNARPKLTFTKTAFDYRLFAHSMTLKEIRKCIVKFPDQREENLNLSSAFFSLNVEEKGKCWTLLKFTLISNSCVWWRNLHERYTWSFDNWKLYYWRKWWNHKHRAFVGWASDLRSTSAYFQFFIICYPSSWFVVTNFLPSHFTAAIPCQKLSASRDDYLHRSSYFWTAVSPFSSFLAFSSCHPWEISTKLFKIKH